MLKYLGKQMGHVISESNPYVTNMASWTHLRDQEFQKEYVCLTRAFSVDARGGWFLTLSSTRQCV
jgi:hypothetical protein